jgi:hypothetical protein
LTTILLALATLPLWSPSSPALFTIVLVASSILASATAFYRTPIVAVATAFGPDAIAAFLSGTALVAVVISAGVFITTYVSGVQGDNGGKAGAILSFVLSVCTVLLSFAAYYFSVRHSDVYRNKFRPRAAYTDPERDRLLQQQLRMVLLQGEGVWATTKRNLGYNIAQCYVFVVTLVSSSPIWVIASKTYL